MSWQLMRLLVELSLSLHFFIRLRIAFGRGWWQLPIIIWLGLMLLPVFFMRRSLLPAAAMDVLAWSWPIWLGFLCFFAFSAISLDLLRLLSGLAGALVSKPWWSLLAAKRAVPTALILAVLIAAFSAYEAYHPRLVRLEIQTRRLPEGLDSLRIAQISDVHLSRFVGHESLKRICGLIAEARPDILAVTGDLVDTDMSGRLADAKLLASVKPRFGSFAVLGNHEMYAGEVNSVNFHRQAELRLLRGEAEEVGGIIIAGIDDEIFSGKGDKMSADKLLSQYKDDPRFVILLKHRPKPAEGTDGLFDLQLSGHTHGGQIFPGHIFVKLAHYYVSGHYSLSSRSSLYVNPGSAFWGLPYRFLAPPEITLIELKRVP